MKTPTKTILIALLMIISGIAGCLDSNTIPNEDSGDDGIDGSNETANETIDNNTGNNITDNNTVNNTNPIDCAENGSGSNDDTSTFIFETIDTWTDYEQYQSGAVVNATIISSNLACIPYGIEWELENDDWDGTIQDIPLGIDAGSFMWNATSMQSIDNLTFTNLSDGSYCMYVGLAGLVDGDWDDFGETCFQVGNGSLGGTDSDYDGWSDDGETECGYDPQDANDTPDDSDGDGICDGLDDSDSDGWTDEDEIACNGLYTHQDPDVTPDDHDGDGICDELDPDFQPIDYMIVGTDETTYVAWLNDWTMVYANITTQNLNQSSEYNVTWFLRNDTDMDGLVDWVVNTGVWPNITEGTSTNTFPVRGPNMAFGLIEGWYCFEAHLWYSSDSINGSGTAIDSDTACFDVTWPADDDGDGFSTAVDCNDSNAAINPNATDIWNGIDDDCDNVVDPFMDRASNASFELQWESIGWVIKNKSSAYEGHELYWLGNTYFAYRFLASPDMVFANGTPCTIDNIVNSPNIVATLAAMGMTSANISVSMTTMDLGTDTEDVEWSYDSNTYIETRYYDGGKFIFKLDGQEFMNVSIGFTEYLNYSQYYSGVLNPNVTMNGFSDVGQMVNGNLDPNLWRLAEAFVIDYNRTIDFTFGSQDAIIQQHYNEDQNSAITLGVNQAIIGLLNCGAGPCPNWIAAEFNQFSAVAASQD